jgi:probable HAF family extracellular repeat protein
MGCSTNLRLVIKRSLPVEPCERPVRVTVRSAKFALVFVLVTSAQVAADPLRFRVVNLGIDGEASGINESGWVAISTSTDGFISDGRRTISVGNNVSPQAINNNGVVVGLTNDFAGPSQAFVWRNGSVSLLPAPTTTRVFASLGLDINDGGVAVGMFVTVESGQFFNDAVIWRGQLPQAISVGSFFTRAEGINNQGTVVGAFRSAPDGADEAFVWTEADGLQPLGFLPGGPDGLNDSYALDINDQATIVGRAHSNGQPVGFFYKSAGMRSFDVPPGSLGISPNAVSNNDWTVGLGIELTDDDEQAQFNRAFLSRNFGLPVYLDTLLDPASQGWRISSAFDVNASGQIAATGFHPDFGSRALRLDPVAPVPEPGTILLLSAAGVAGGVRKWRLRERH